MSVMSNEVMFKAGASFFTNSNSRAGIICNLRRLNDRFARAGNLDPGILHTTHAHVRDAKIGVSNANAHSALTRNVKTGEARVVNVLSQNRHVGRKDPGAMERRAHNRNTAPQMQIFVIFARTYFNGISRPRSFESSSNGGDRIWTHLPGSWRVHHPTAKFESVYGVLPVWPRCQEHGRCREQAEKEPGPLRRATRRTLSRCSCNR